MNTGLDPAFVAALDLDDDAPDGKALAGFLRLRGALAASFAGALRDNRTFVRTHRPVDPALEAFVRRTWW